jgi:protein-S-isoprenylcysteine O-methyltransferase Ste14
VRKRLSIGVVGGLVWGVVGAAAFLAMFRGGVPAPGEVGLPLAAVLVALYLPFVFAAGVETAAGRASSSLGEIIGVTLASGAGLGLIVTAGITLLRKRLVRSARSRS